ncbi:hypothetical protein DUNSADRAFT_1577 [Dunaliella salina]|uniref:Encoded protein n=1 Tax=Dunaliella salina TaxID=3046 RepID=A0ABQ7H8G5_DUNSA|nr:hypothetical protein DUNSADRAFT_1577 [Dunaliella salina]|eukprot:KAF5843150.1 hypothetical protein DUNSADRAFT_1577 [Dunaliella salina]
MGRVNVRGAKPPAQLLQPLLLQQQLQRRIQVEKAGMPERRVEVAGGQKEGGRGVGGKGSFQDGHFFVLSKDPSLNLRSHVCPVCYLSFILAARIKLHRLAFYSFPTNCIDSLIKRESMQL